MRKAWLLLLPSVVVLGGGCTDSASSETKLSLRILPTVESRITGLHFDKDDCIGLTVVRTSGEFLTNQKMTYSEGSFAASGVLWYNDLNETSTLTAYTPYSEQGMPAEFTVATNQQAGCTASDLLVARTEGARPSEAPLAMTFHHLLAQLTVSITNSSAAAVSEVRIGGLVPTATVDYTAQTATAKSGVAAAEITACELTANSSYQAVLIPQQATLTLTVLTEDGKSRSRTVEGAQIDGGRRYTLSVSVTNIDIAMNLSGDITDWEDGGSLDDKKSDNGDNGDNSSSGSTTTITYEGETYSYATIGDAVWMTENLRYRPSGATLAKNMWYPKDGETAVAEQGMLYTYAIATGGVAAATTDSEVQGICPTGWHVPTEAELQAVVNNPAAAPDGFFSCYAGFITAMTNTYSTSTKSCLLSASNNGSQVNCLISEPSEEIAPKIILMPIGNGYSLRCVKNKN